MSIALIAVLFFAFFASFFASFASKRKLANKKGRLSEPLSFKRYDESV